MHPGQAIWLLNHYPNTVEAFLYALLLAHESGDPEGVQRLGNAVKEFAQQEGARLERIRQVGEP